MQDYDIANISSNFSIEGDYVSSEIWGQGHINDTYLVVYSNNGRYNKYIIQRINHRVFPNIPKLMDNIIKVTEHIRQEIIKSDGDPNRSVLQFINTCKGCNHLLYNGNYYRAYHFIDNVLNYQVVNSAEDIFQCGAAFGKFQKHLRDFTAEELYDVIPDFHNTRVRYNNLISAAEADTAGRKKSCKSEIQFFIRREHYVDRIVDMMKEGAIPVKVTHNDTKINNVLIDELTGEGICVIDLDTVMAGSVLFDFGDSVRSGCSSAAEDQRNLSLVKFKIDYFEQYARGFLSEVGDTLNKSERDNLAFSGLLMTMECGMRFLTDYLNGDVYFKVNDDRHNLRRALTHTKLIKDIEKNMPQMERIIDSLIKGDE